MGPFQKHSIEMQIHSINGTTYLRFDMKMNILPRPLIKSKQCLRNRGSSFYFIFYFIVLLCTIANKTKHPLPALGQKSTSNLI